MRLRGMNIHSVNGEKVVAHILAVCIIMSSSTMYTTLTISPLNIRYMALLVCIFSFIGVLLYRRVSRKTLVWIGLLAVYYLLYVFATDTKYSFFMYIVIPLLAMFLYIYETSREGKLSDFAEAFVNIVVLEAAISSFCYIFGTQLDVLPARTALSYEWTGSIKKCATYLFVYFDNTTQMQSFMGVKLMRNTGIFPEAPAHAGVLVYAMVFEILHLNRNPGSSKRKIVILTIAMLTTLSTKAFLELIIIFLCWYQMSISRRKRNRAVNYILLVAAVIVGIFLIQYILADKSSSRSYVIRMDMLSSSIKAWFSSPVFGLGYGSNDEILEYSEITRSGNGLSMGMTAVLAQGGIYLFAIYVIAGLRYFMLKLRRGEVWEAIFVIAALGTNFFISNCGFNLSFLMFVCMGLSTGVKRRSKYVSVVGRVNYVGRDNLNEPAQRA